MASSCFLDKKTNEPLASELNYNNFEICSNFMKTFPWKKDNKAMELIAT